MFASRSRARPRDWLPVLSAYIVAVAPQRDVALYLDGRLADVGSSTLQTIVARACAYLSEGLEFAQVVLLDGEGEAPAAAEPVRDPAEPR